MSTTSYSHSTKTHNYWMLLDNSVGGANRDRTDDLLHAIQARRDISEKPSSNELKFQLADDLFTGFTPLTSFHKSSGGELGETHFSLTPFVGLSLGITFPYFSGNFTSLIANTTSDESGGILNAKADA